MIPDGDKVVIEWCGLCNSKPSEGKMTFEIDDETKETVDLPCCRDCARVESWGHNVKGLNV